MHTLRIMLHEAGGKDAAGKLAPIMCPYLASIGWRAELQSVRRHRELKGSDEWHPGTTLDIQLSGDGSVEDTLKKVRKFLRNWAQDADLSVACEFIWLETPSTDAASSTFTASQG